VFYKKFQLTVSVFQLIESVLCCATSTFYSVDFVTTIFFTLDNRWKCGLKLKNCGLNFRPQFSHGFETVVYSAVGVAQSPQFF